MYVIKLIKILFYQLPLKKNIKKLIILFVHFLVLTLKLQLIRNQLILMCEGSGSLVFYIYNFNNKKLLK